MLGLPLDSWILVVASVAVGLTLEVAYLRARRAERGRTAGDGGPAETGAGAAGRTAGKDRP